MENQTEMKEQVQAKQHLRGKEVNRDDQILIRF